MNKSIRNFYAKMFIWSNFSAVHLFVNYILIWFVIECVFVVIETFLGISYTHRWYDTLLSISIAWTFIFNIEYVFDTMKGKQ